MPKVCHFIQLVPLRYLSRPPALFPHRDTNLDPKALPERVLSLKLGSGPTTLRRCDTPWGRLPVVHGCGTSARSTDPPVYLPVCTPSPVRPTPEPWDPLSADKTRSFPWTHTPVYPVPLLPRPLGDTPVSPTSLPRVETQTDYWNLSPSDPFRIQTHPKHPWQSSSRLSPPPGHPSTPYLPSPPDPLFPLHHRSNLFPISLSDPSLLHLPSGPGDFDVSRARTRSCPDPVPTPLVPRGSTSPPSDWVRPHVEG